MCVLKFEWRKKYKVFKKYPLIRIHSWLILSIYVAEVLKNIITCIGNKKFL